MLRRLTQTTPYAVLVLALVALALTACAQKSPEERVAEARTKYSIRSTSFLPQEPAAPVDAMDEGMMGDEMVDETSDGEMPADAATEDSVDGTMDDADGDAMADAGGEGDGMATAKHEVLFDLIVQFDGNDPLPGVTVEITHADPFEKEKGSFRHYLETGPMVKSETKQLSFTVPDLDFVDGDLFSVDIRGHVPPEERGEYREFAETQFD